MLSLLRIKSKRFGVPTRAPSAGQSIPRRQKRALKKLRRLDGPNLPIPAPGGAANPEAWRLWPIKSVRLAIATHSKAGGAGQGCLTERQWNPRGSRGLTVPNAQPSPLVGCLFLHCPRKKISLSSVEKIPWPVTRTREHFVFLDMAAVVRESATSSSEETTS